MLGCAGSDFGPSIGEVLDTSFVSGYFLDNFFRISSGFICSGIF